MKKIIYSFILLITSFPLFAQMAAPSIFPEMKSINPAVISYRWNRALSMVGKVDHSKKNQDLSSSFGAGSNSTEKGTITTYNGFYGGQGDRNGGITSEIQFNMAHGSLEFNFDLTNIPQGESKLDGKANTTFIDIGLGFWRFFGLSFAHLGITSESTFSADLNGSTVSNNTKDDMTYNRIRLGMRLPLIFSLGFYGDHTIYESKSSADAQDPSAPPQDGNKSLNLVGMGLGFNARLLHLEAFAEKQIQSNSQPATDAGGNTIYKKYNPMRLGGTAEIRFGKLALGYTGLYCIDGFTDLDRVIYDSLMYGTSKTNSRLENTFNFSLGNEKGHVFGGSAFYTTMKTQEASMLDSENKFPTSVTVMGFALKYSYAF